MRHLAAFALVLLVATACCAESPTTLPTTRPINSIDEIFAAIPGLPLRVEPSLESLEKATRKARTLKGRVITFHVKPTAIEKSDRAWVVCMSNTEYLYHDKQVWLNLSCAFALDDEARAKAFKVGEVVRMYAVIDRIEFDRWHKQLRLNLSAKPLSDPAIGH